MMSVTSSFTPGRVVNSWRASSKRTWVMAAPGIDDSSVRRRELPSVWPKPGSSGPTAKRWRLSSSSPIASTVGRWMMSMGGTVPLRLTDYFEYSSTMSCSRTGTSMWSR